MRYTGSLVRLRSLEEGDLNDLWRHLNDLDTMALVTDSPILPATAEDAERLLREQTSHSTGVYQFAVETLAERRFLGRCGFVGLDRKNRHGEIAIHLGEGRGRGCGADAVRILCRLGFEELGLHKITARTFEFNLACARCLEKCGFRREGLLRDELYRDGQWHGIYVFGLLRTQWPEGD